MQFTIILSLGINLLIVKMINSYQLFVFVIGFQLFLSVLLVIGYFYIGLTIYRKKLPRICVILLIVGYFSLSASMMIDFTNKNSSKSFLFLFLPLLFASFGFFCFSKVESIKRLSSNP